MDLELRKFIVCDDIRVEIKGKLILIGMYPEDKIIVNSDFPYTHSSLSFYMHFSGRFSKGELQFQISAEDGNILLTLPPIKLDNPGKDLQMNFGINQFQFSAPGTYKILLTFPKIKPYEIPFFVIKGRSLLGETDSNS